MDIHTIHITQLQEIITFKGSLNENNENYYQPYVFKFDFDLSKTTKKKFIEFCDSLKLDKNISRVIFSDSSYIEYNKYNNNLILSNSQSRVILNIISNYKLFIREIETLRIELSK